MNKTKRAVFEVLLAAGIFLYGAGNVRAQKASVVTLAENLSIPPNSMVEFDPIKTSSYQRVNLFSMPTGNGTAEIRLAFALEPARFSDLVPRSGDTGCSVYPDTFPCSFEGLTVSGPFLMVQVKNLGSPTTLTLKLYLMK